MRDYAIISSKFWTGDTGRHLRQNPDAQRLAIYLLTCANSNMIGLYYLPMPVICHELNMTREGASKALRWASEGAFAYYDDASETVFVPEMARFQVGENLKAGDKRIGAVEKLIEAFRKSPFFNEFLEKYKAAFRLKTEPNTCPIEGASKGHQRGIAQEQEQEQDQEHIHPSDVCSELPSTESSEPPILTFPTCGKGSKEWHLTQSKVDEYAASFPGVDVMAECRKARQWCIDNPPKRKTARGMPAYLSRWLGRAQDRAAGFCGIPTGPPRETPVERAMRVLKETAPKEVHV